MSKNDPNKVNPYRKDSAYYKVLEHCRKAQVVTREGLIEAGFSKFDVGVVLSPTKESKRGDCRGNRSAQGHNHYFERLGKKTEKGITSPNRYRFHWRVDVLAPRKRQDKVMIPAVKIKVEKKVEKKVKAPAETKGVTTEKAAEVKAPATVA